MIQLTRSTKLSPFATITLNNGQHNPFSDKIIKELQESVNEIRKMNDCRGVVLRSNGKSFSAGGDLEWMKRASKYTKSENVQDALALSRFLNDFSSLPFPTIAAVQGPALGGGVGLISVCDIAVSVRSAFFALSEVRLGLLPATISPFVFRRIGAAQARRYFLTGERIPAERAYQIGLIHELVDQKEDLDKVIGEIQKSIVESAPNAISETKKLIEAIEGKQINEALLQDTAERLAHRRSTEEAKEGLNAFFEKRKPKWAQ